jgi:hypothetical protein
MNKTQVLLSIGNQSEKNALLPFIEVASENKSVIFYTTEHTHQFLKENNINSTLVYKISQMGKHPNVSELLSKRIFNYIINIPSRNTTEARADYTDGEIIRRIAAEYGIISITDLDVAEIILGNLGSK